jgi:hypothetical protein
MTNDDSSGQARGKGGWRKAGGNVVASFYAKQACNAKAAAQSAQV